MFDCQSVSAKNPGAVCQGRQLWCKWSSKSRVGVWEDCHYVDALMIFREGVLPQWEVRGKKNDGEDHTSTWQWFIRCWPTNLALDNLKMIQSLVAARWFSHLAWSSWENSEGHAHVLVILDLGIWVLQESGRNWWIETMKGVRSSLVVTSSNPLGQTHRRNLSLWAEIVFSSPGMTRQTLMLESLAKLARMRQTLKADISSFISRQGMSFWGELCEIPKFHEGVRWLLVLRCSEIHPLTSNKFCVGIVFYASWQLRK